MKKETFISLKDSQNLYGIAILLMIFHHCFCIPDRLGYNYIPVFFNFEMEARLAYLGKLCVAIYAFVTGYALAQKRNPEKDLIKHVYHDIKTSICMLIKLYSKLWFVCLVFLPIGFLFFHQPFVLKNIIKDLFFGIGGYNGEWWYVKQYVYFVCIYPVIETFFYYFLNKDTQKKTVQIVCAGIVLTILLRLFFWKQFIQLLFLKVFIHLKEIYMLIFLSAYFIGKFRIYEYIHTRTKDSKMISLLLIVLILLIRWKLVLNPAGGELDVLITPFLIYPLVLLIKDSRHLSFLGKYSTYMWLTHTFLIYYYFQKIILLPRVSILIYIWSVLLSLLTAMLMDTLEKKLKIHILVKQLTKIIQPL